MACNHHPHSPIFNMNGPQFIDGKFVRVMSWYDNEWAFSCHMVDTAIAMSKAGRANDAPPAPVEDRCRFEGLSQAGGSLTEPPILRPGSAELVRQL